VADWTVISSMATAGGTLVLAIATFSSVRSSSRSARVAERAMLTSQRPILVPSREDDLVELVRFGDGIVLEVRGHGCAVEVHNERVYMAIALRNGGAGVAVLHSWHVEVSDLTGSVLSVDPSSFRRQQRDLFIPAGSTGFWQGAIRDPEDPDYEVLREAATTGARIMVDLLYGDHEGGQRAVARFGAYGASDGDGGRTEPRAEVLRYWNIDGADPR
jgi:hypothetical protein